MVNGGDGMKQVVIVKLGSTMDHLAQRRGDFEDLIRAGLAIDDSRVRVVDPIAGEQLPDPELVAGAVLTGAHASVLSREPWSERTAAWLPELIAAGVPLLGICYGHQLLALALGGQVGRMAEPEFGTVTVELTPEAQADPLFTGLPSRLQVQSTHTDCVTELPPAAVRLAANPADRNQAFAVPPASWGVQFHPEFDADVVRTYIRDWQSLLCLEDAEALAEAVTEAPESRTILHRFTRMALHLEPPDARGV
jgi:GMP synthase (glutamine-hydrolysing)